METPGLIVQTSREPDNYRLETVDGARVILQAIQAAGMVQVHLQNAFENEVRWQYSFPPTDDAARCR